MLFSECVFFLFLTVIILLEKYNNNILERLFVWQARSFHPTLVSWIMLSPKEVAQRNPSYPALCRREHHISVYHRLLRKHLLLTSDTNASNEIYLEEKKIKQRKKKHESGGHPEMGEELLHRGPKIEFWQENRHCHNRNCSTNFFVFV